MTGNSNRDEEAAMNEFDAGTADMTLSGELGDVQQLLQQDEQEKRRQEQALERFRVFLRDVVLPQKIETGFFPRCRVWLQAFDRVFRMPRFKTLYRTVYDLDQGQQDDFLGIILARYKAVILSLKGNVFQISAMDEVKRFVWQKETQQKMFLDLFTLLKKWHQICQALKKDAQQLWDYVDAENTSYYWPQCVSQFFNVINALRLLKLMELEEVNGWDEDIDHRNSGYGLTVIDQDGVKVIWRDDTVISLTKTDEEGRELPEPKADLFKVSSPEDLVRFTESLGYRAPLLFHALPKTQAQFFQAIEESFRKQA